MSEPPPRQPNDQPPAPFDPTLSPPAMRCPMAPGEVIDRLHRASKRGKLAGFERIDTDRFRVAVFGAPFDRRLIGEVTQNGPAAAITFTSRLDQRPIIAAWVILALTLWPGVLLTHSFLGGWRWYASQFPTWMATCLWYVPLTVLAIPALLGAQRKSNRAAAEETVGVWQRIAEVLGGRLATESEPGSI